MRNLVRRIDDAERSKVVYFKPPGVRSKRSVVTYVTRRFLIANR